MKLQNKKNLFHTTSVKTYVQKDYSPSRETYLYTRKYIAFKIKSIKLTRGESKSMSGLTFQVFNLKISHLEKIRVFGNH